MDWIRIDGLDLRCIVGLHSFERKRPQHLHLDVAMGLDLSTAGRSGQIGDSVDYARVASEISALLHFRKYRLLEVAAEEIAAFLFALHPSVGQIKQRLDKPEALAGRARSAAVETLRSRGAFSSQVETTDFGTKTTLLHAKEAIIEAHRISPGVAAEFNDATARLEAEVKMSDLGALPLTSPAVLQAGQPSSYAESPEGHLVVRCLSLLEEEA